jgi:perosamine synthetase
VGFNYRMTNLQAAVGVAQLERAERFIQRKRAIAELYDELLTGVPGLTRPVELPGYTNVYWMYSVLVDDAYGLLRDDLIPALRERGIDSRPFFHPLDTLPPYASATPCPTALDLSRRGLNLPSSPTLTDEQVLYICDTLRELAQ